MRWSDGARKAKYRAMASNRAPSARWHHVTVARSPQREALVLCLCTSGECVRTEAMVQPWALLVPRSGFAVLELELPLTDVIRQHVLALIASEVAGLGLSVPQLVLVGHGEAASAVLELALSRTLAGAGAILIDLPRGGGRLGKAQSRSAFRFVQHDAPDTTQSLHVDQTVHALRQAGHDIRTIGLPNAAEPTERAIGAFLVELVARASRHHTIARAPGSAPSKDFP